MKVRRGFVSNSSSSSFIVAFDRIPQNVEETQKALFGDKDGFWYDSWDGGSQITGERAAQEVWGDMQDQVPNDEERVNQELCEHGHKMADFLKTYGEDKVVFVFDYGDEDGSFHAALEHGGLFENLPHTRVSHH